MNLGGFKFIVDYGQRHVKNNKGKEISIISFEDDEFEIAWIDENGKILEEGEGLEELKNIIDYIEGKITCG